MLCAIIRTRRELNPMALFGGSRPVEQVFRIDDAHASHRRCAELVGIEQPDTDIPRSRKPLDDIELHDELPVQRDAHSLLKREQLLRAALTDELRLLFTTVLSTHGKKMDKTAAAEFTSNLVGGLQAVCDALLAHRARHAIRVVWRISHRSEFTAAFAAMQYNMLEQSANCACNSGWVDCRSLHKDAARCAWPLLHCRMM